jgi:tRNA(fMet)-specific endonuclease VapC
LAHRQAATTALARRLADRDWASLSRRGQLVGAHDLWIAATALALGLGVVTTDAGDFERIPGLRVLAAS